MVVCLSDAISQVIISRWVYLPGADRKCLTVLWDPLKPLPLQLLLELITLHPTKRARQAAVLLPRPELRLTLLHGPTAVEIYKRIVRKSHIIIH